MDKTTKPGQWRWFVGLWLAGVVALALVAGLLHLLIDLVR